MVVSDLDVGKTNKDLFIKAKIMHELMIGFCGN